MLYITPPRLIYFITGSLYVLTPFTHFIYPPPPFWQHPIYSLCLSSFFFFLKIPHISKIIQYLSFSAWLISLSIMPSSSMLLQMARLPSFLWLNNTPLHTHTHTHTYMCVHIFFIHLSIHGHVGCFHQWQYFLFLEVIFGSFPNFLVIYDTLLFFTHIFGTFRGTTLKLTAGVCHHLFYIIHVIISISEILWYLIQPWLFAHGDLFPHVFFFAILCWCHQQSPLTIPGEKK